MYDRGENWQSVVNAVLNMRQESKIAALRNVLKKNIHKRINEATKNEKSHTNVTSKDNS